MRCKICARESSSFAVELDGFVDVAILYLGTNVCLCVGVRWSEHDDMFILSCMLEYLPTRQYSEDKMPYLGTR